LPKAQTKSFSATSIFVLLFNRETPFEYWEAGMN